MASLEDNRFETALRARLSPGAVDHSMRVAEMADVMAAAYDVDREEAYLAGLLHDWAREMDAADLVDRAESVGIPVDDVDRKVPYLLHGPVGALLLESEFPDLPSSVISAVEKHTYGAPAMDALSMVVYVADTIEPGRRHDGAAELRALVGEVPLEELFARAYAASMQHLVSSRKAIHPMTVMVWNTLIAGGPR